MTQATEIFGGNAAVLQLLAGTVEGTRRGKGWTVEQLAQLAGEGDAKTVEAIEGGRKLPPKNILLAYLDALGVQLQNVLKIESLPGHVENYWRQEMRRRGVALLARAEGSNSKETTSLAHEQWALGLFLRLEALSEICEPSNVRLGNAGEVAQKVQSILEANV